MYIQIGFKDSNEVIKWLNENNIDKKDIISLVYDANKTNEYWIYTLIYYSQFDD
jgi:hypothetical protein